ncbi:MAG: hypothetical protein QW464_08570 [Ignisphaera sp.]|uniref:hypothetical protein n=1 Tax=Desulfurococcus sp. TaxID=51678 RepID=UPI003169189A
MERHKGEYYVIYYGSRNPKRSVLGVKFPSLKSPLYIKLGGERARNLYKHIILTLDNLGIPYSTEKESLHEVLRVPWATGLAITIFLLAIYSKRKPLAYAHVLDKMLTGSMPLARHLTNMTEIALDLSEYLGNTRDKPLITHKSAATISKMMVTLINALHI